MDQQDHLATPNPATMPRMVDAETIAAENPRDHRIELRLWLRLLTCATLIEDEIRLRLRRTFHVTLPRFDLMAQLAKAPAGMKMSELSSRMMVTNGNLTALVERLARAGHLTRRTSDHDRRITILALTPAGAEAFGQMATAHAEWMAELMAGLPTAEIEQMMPLLARLKASAAKARRGETAAGKAANTPDRM